MTIEELLDSANELLDGDMFDLSALDKDEARTLVALAIMAREARLYMPHAFPNSLQADWVRRFDDTRQKFEGAT